MFVLRRFCIAQLRTPNIGVPAWGGMRFIAMSKRTFRSHAADTDKGFPKQEKQLQRDKRRRRGMNVTMPLKAAGSEKLRRVAAFCTAQEYDLEHLLHHLKATQSASRIVENVLYSDFKPVNPLSANTGPRELFIFRDGAFVCWGTDPDDEAAIISLLSRYEEGRFSPPATEEFDFQESLRPSTVHGDIITIGVRDDDHMKDVKEQHMQVVQDKLAFSYGLMRSVKLEVLEDQVDDAISRMRGIPSHMAVTGKLGLTQKEITQRMGQLLELRSYLNLHGSLLDTPDVYWDEPKLEGLFHKISANLEVNGRISKLNKKLDYCHELVEVLKSHASSQHSSRLELIIIALISTEILISLQHYYLQ